MNCIICNKEIPRGKRYQGNKYKSLHFCSEECFNKYCKIKSAPKPLINFKPEKGTDRREFTDYIQEWTGDKVNWALIMKQAKDIQEEYNLNWHEMYLVCKYAHIYEGVEWDFNYGLGQIFPRYIQPCINFQEAIKNAKSVEIPIENIIKIHKKKYEKKVDW